MKILLVDDDDDVRTVASLSLSRIGGMDVVTASSGVEAIEKALESAPDAIVLDMMMPEMDGISTFRKLREHPSLEKTPIVFLTAKVLPSETRELVEMGATGFLAKPFDPVELPVKLREILGR